MEFDLLVVDTVKQVLQVGNCRVRSFKVSQDTLVVNLFVDD